MSFGASIEFLPSQQDAVFAQRRRETVRGAGVRLGHGEQAGFPANSWRAPANAEAPVLSSTLTALAGQLATRKPRALPWAGGKARPALNRWIRGLLGTRTDLVYVEPYGGMVNILLARPRSRVEIICDTNGLVTDWWLSVVEPEDRRVLEQRFALTPARVEGVLREALLIGEDLTAPRVKRAWALAVVSRCSFMAADGDRTDLAVSFAQTPSGFDSIELDRLADRMRDVQVISGDGVELMQKLVERDDTLVYCDPPYTGAAEPLYGQHSDFRRAEMLDAMLAMRGRCAVSGTPEDWPELEKAGWDLRRMPITSKPGHGSSRTRVEALWRNPLLAEEASTQLSLL